MITFKTITFDELKKDYLGRHGFVLQSNQKSSDTAIEDLCNVLIGKEITSEYPEFVTRIDDNTTVFVYKDDFNSPKFCQVAMMANQLRFFVVDTLYRYLTN